MVKYLDPHELTKGNPIETVTLSSTEYASHYAPEVADTVTSVLPHQTQSRPHHDVQPGISAART